MSRSTRIPVPQDPDERDLKDAARALGLYGLLARWDEYGSCEWLSELIEIERKERARRSLERRLRNAKLLNFKPIADFDWKWPKRIDREQIEDLMKLRFMAEAANVLLVGSNGVGKTMIAKNIAHSAILAGQRVHFTTATAMLNDLGSQPTTRDLERRLRRYSNPALLVIDEIGYLASTADHADLLFEVVNRRYEQHSTIITTNKAFSEWGTVFPNAACITVMVDRLIHRSELISIEGGSYRLKDAEERKKKRRPGRPKKKPATEDDEVEF